MKRVLQRSIRYLGVLPWLVAALCLVPDTVGAQDPVCGDPFRNHFGPFDYNTATQPQRDIVERFHFTEQVATLRRGQSTFNIGADIAYTLRVFPNHPRALMSMASLAQREKKERPVGSEYTLSCWFERAIRFRPEDPAVRMAYGIALSKESKYPAALEQFLKAFELSPNNANIQYNLGLTYFELKDYGNALKHAKSAYQLGFPLLGLRNRLESVNEWK